MSTHTLSLWSAILINLNVMIGSGIFVNTVLLSQVAGGLAPVAYIAVGVLILPLILSISRLSQLHKGGSFYDYGAAAHPYVGFLAITSYFIAKLSSCTLAIHMCVSLLQSIFPRLAAIPTLAFDASIVGLFALLNTLNLRAGKRIQIAFIIGKCIPILFAILVGLYLFQPTYFQPQYLYPTGVVTAVPFVLYAFMGFEVTCSLSKALEDPEKNGPRAILGAYGLGMLIACLFQLLLYASIGPRFQELSSYLQTFPMLLEILQLSQPLAGIGKVMLHLGIAASALGAAYGIMYSNAWNLFELGCHGHIVMKNMITQLNKHKIPIVCVLIEALIVLIYLMATRGCQVPLQQISAFGSTISYTLCVVGLVALHKRTGRIGAIPVLGFLSCGLLLLASLKNFSVYGAVPGIVFVCILGLASLMYKGNRAA